MKSDSNMSFKSRLAEILFYYRTVPHSVTNIAPCVALKNRKFIATKDRVHPHYVQSKSHEHSKQVRVFQVGDSVLALNLREGPKWYNGSIIAKLGVNVFNVLIDDLNVIWKRHSNQLLKRNENSGLCSRSSIYRDSSMFQEVAESPYVTSPLDSDISCESRVSGQAEAQMPRPDTTQEIVESSNTHHPIDSGISLRRSNRVRKPVKRFGFND